LIPKASVNVAPGGSMVVKLPPVSRKPCIVEPSLNTPTIWPLLLIPRGWVATAPGTLIVVKLPPIQEATAAGGSHDLAAVVDPEGFGAKSPGDIDVGEVAPVSKKPWVVPEASLNTPTIWPLSLIPRAWAKEAPGTSMLVRLTEASIMRQTGHRSVQMVRRYIREGSVFHDNAGAKLGL
jgi:hypothetical protein